uniref:Ovule protein n=1 Tax=Haemonchus contortus TaxID=6289 RepID=A0A7I4XUJ2_HAECO
MKMGEPLLDYLRKNRNLFEVNSDPTPGFENKIMGMEFNDEGSNPVVNSNDEPGDEIPDYDPRNIWANCFSFSTIRDQANCGLNAHLICLGLH